ncbi:MAG: rhodanese-like domain-containing protein, partial [Cyanobacteria bacterium J06598_3]
SRSASASEQLTVQALAAEIEQGRAPLILDVRSPEEYAEGHIPGAVNIPFREMPDQLNKLRQLSSQLDGEPGEVIIYCERGVRANIAEQSLIEAGFTTTIQLTGHMKAWRDGNLPIETGK